MSMEFDRRKKETPATEGPSPTAGNAGNEGGDKPKGLGEMAGPETDKNDIRKQIHDRASETSKAEKGRELSESSKTASDRASEEQRNRDLWKK